VSDNPLDDSNQARHHRIRERAYHLWAADGSPHGRSDEYWERARELVGMEESPHTGEIPANTPDRDNVIDEAVLQDNLGEFPGRLTDQGERAATPSRANLKTGSK
jgi:hypothetical protein